MPYSGDPSSSTRDAVRFWSQDTDTAREFLTDAEVDYLISTATNADPIWIASTAALAIAAKFTGEATVVGDGVTVDVAQLKRDYLALATALRSQFKEQAGAAGPELLDDSEVDSTQAPYVFGLHMSDNPLAGRQDYGDGTTTGPYASDVIE